MTKRVFLYCDDGYIPSLPASFTNDLREIANLIDNDTEHEAFIIEFRRGGIVGVNRWKSLQEFYNVMAIQTEPTQ